MQFRIPGPTPCHPKVLEAASRQMIDHRGKEFGEILGKLTGKLKQVFQTKNDIFIMTASGTGGMEAAVVNTLSPGDKVIATTCGFFGDRFAEIAEIYGARVTRLNFDMGKPVDPEAVRTALKEAPDTRAVLVTHNESSTGVTNDVKTIASIAKAAGALVLVDSVSGLSSIDIPVDEWNLDVVATASQKGWMAPPGLAMVSVSPAAWKAHASAKMPRNYFDFSKWKKFSEINQTPWTPAVGVFFALDVACDLILAEGIQNVFARHARCAQVARDGARAMGLSPLTDPKCASNTVTAINAPANLDVNKMQKILREEFKVFIAGGQGKLTGKIFRIGHLGWVAENDMKEVLAALAKAIPRATI
jgi:aspartate aminotransferase-like enzyme